MNDQQILWLIIALAVLILIVAIVVIVGSRRRARKREADRQEAERIRQQASRQQDLVAAEAEAAESAQLEAEAAEERAQQLRAEAEERQQEADSAASALEAQLREADRKDPSVAVDREGRRRDGTDPLEELAERDQPGSHIADQLLESDDGQAPGTEGERRVRRDVDESVRRDDTGRADAAAAAGERRPSAEEPQSQGRRAAPVPADRPTESQADVVQDVDNWSAGDGEAVVDRPAGEVRPADGVSPADQANPAEESVAEQSVGEDRSDVADGRGSENGEQSGEDRGGSHAAGQ